MESGWNMIRVWLVGENCRCGYQEMGVVKLKCIIIIIDKFSGWCCKEVYKDFLIIIILTYSYIFHLY